MAVYCYLDGWGRSVPSTSEHVVTIKMTDSGYFFVDAEAAPNWTKCHKKFQNWKQAREFLLSRFPGQNFRSVVELGLVLYFAGPDMAPCGRAGADVAIVPEGKRFRACVLLGGRCIELGTGTLDLVRVTLKKFLAADAKATIADVNDRLLWLDDKGERAASAKEATYLRLKWDGKSYKFWRLFEDYQELLLTGTKEDCVNLIQKMQEEKEAANVQSSAQELADTRSEVPGCTDCKTPVNVSSEDTVASQGISAPDVANTDGSPDDHSKQNVTLEACYYDNDGNALGEVLTTSARYKVHLLSGWSRWAVSGRGSSRGRFHRLTNIQFKSVEEASSWIYLYKGATTLEFLDAKRERCSFHLAYFCRRIEEDQEGNRNVIMFRKSDKRWARFLDGTESDVSLFEDESEVKQVIHYTSKGVICSAGQATYREFVVVPGVFHRFLVQEEGTWKPIKCGTPQYIEEFKTTLFTDTEMNNRYSRLKSKSAKQDLNKEPPKSVEDNVVDTKSTDSECVDAPASVDKLTTPHPSVKGLWERVKDTTWVRAGDLSGYIAMCVCRNRTSGNSPVFDTRLSDKFGQPIYACDLEYGTHKGKGFGYIDMSRVPMLSNITDIRRVIPNAPEVPEPVCFFKDVSECIWDPTKPVLPVTQRTLEHICVERITRFPAELQEVNPVHLMEAIQDSLRRESTKARRDSFYALPSFSREHDEVSMLLPVYIPLLFKEKVVITLVLSGGAQGYRVVTALDTGRAVRSVSMFRDPRTTWLKECYNDAPIMDTEITR